jgi:hypothetical protein
MSLVNNSISQQFNSYKFIELTDRLFPLMYDLSDHQKQIGVKTLHDCRWTRSIQNLSSYWQQHYRQPEISSK